MTADLNRPIDLPQTHAHWLERLINGITAGYWTRDEELEEFGNVVRGRGEQFPWQGKRCRDCPFWSNSICQVLAEYRSSSADTCMYSDSWNHEAAKRIIAKRQAEGFARWWGWFKGEQP